MIEIDGSYLEGGGQIIRTALSLSVLTGQPFRVFNIRKNRAKPGLREQHLQSVNAAAKICNGKHDAKLHAQEFSFFPSEIVEKDFEVKLDTAGSTALVIAVLLPLALKINRKIKIKILGGGTWNKFAPPVIYIQEVILPILKKSGLNAEIEIRRDGFPPKGGGEVELVLFPPKEKRELAFTEGDEIKIISIASKSLQERKVAERQMEAAEKLIVGLNKKINKEINYIGADKGCGILVQSGSLAADNIGEIGKTAEKVGEEAAKKFILETREGAKIDENGSDQLMICQAIVGGEIVTSKISEHARTNAWVIEKFLPVKFELNKKIIKIK